MSERLQSGIYKTQHIGDKPAYLTNNIVAGENSTQEGRKQPRTVAVPNDPKQYNIKSEHTEAYPHGEIERYPVTRRNRTKSPQQL